MKRSKILGLVLSGIFAFNLAAISSVNAATTDNSVKEETTSKIQAISDSDKYNGECNLYGLLSVINNYQF